MTVVEAHMHSELSSLAASALHPTRGVTGLAAGAFLQPSVAEEQPSAVLKRMVCPTSPVATIG